jgi:hypothetical protein
VKSEFYQNHNNECIMLSIKERLFVWERRRRSRRRSRRRHTITIVNGNTIINNSNAIEAHQ